jgi:NAD+ diphosphatase
MWPVDHDDFESLVTPPADQALDDAWYFVFVGKELLSGSEHGAPRPLTADEYRWLDVTLEKEMFLGRYQGRACFAVSASGRSQQGYAQAGLRSWLGRVAAPLFYLAGRAQQIADWHSDHQFCGRCGEPTEDHATDRAKVCKSCGLVSYPKLSPSIIVLVRRGEDVLLARNARWPEGTYSTLAGFVEPGESIEQTVHREVLEEVGIRVTNLRYKGSQSWPFPNSLMLGFYADYHSGDVVCQDAEIAEARWFHYTRLPNIPGGAAISRWLIDDCIEELSRAGQ